MTLSKHIINWYIKHKRDLPWRHTNNPYFIWLSEIILQQTRVEQGMPYYLKFTDKYKTVKQLALAKDDDVMKMWQGLGYYNRAANMLNTARIIMKEHEGVFPKTYNDLLKLKGIGPYTAAAVSSFAFDEAQAVVDGNVNRVLSRIFCIDEPINSSLGKKIFTQLAQEILDDKQPALHNQALMELGALVCKPRSPLCGECPVRLQCMAFAKKIVANYPVKIKENKPQDRFLNYFFIDQKDKTFITQRTKNAIWKGLYELPNFESEKTIESEKMISQKKFIMLFGNIDELKVEKIFSKKHQLTHQTIYADFFKITSPQKIKPLPEGFIQVRLTDLMKYAVPRLFDKFLNYLNLHSNL